MTTLLAVCAVLTVGLSAYALGHYFCALVFVVTRRPPAPPKEVPPGSVSVLVPARNEGERALRVIASLLEQDHAGPVDIYLLVRDEADTAIPLLAKAYPGASLRGDVGATVTLLERGGRRVLVTYTGLDPKSAKINFASKSVDSDFVAILDCDHQAYPGFLSTSIARMREAGARMVQARRDPLTARGFYSLWDSLHQHVGCELFNAAFTRLGLTVFFTGTTAVMETSLLREHPFSSSITEDLDFSYEVILSGTRIVDNPHSGSCEETSPDLYSFLARRRRWSNGHTTAFFHHLRRGRLGRLSWHGRVQFLYHGAHYLVSVFVFALHLMIGLVFLRTFSPTSQFAAVVSSFLLSILVARTQRTIGFFARLTEIVVVFAWLFPAIVIAMNIAQAILLDDFSRAALPISHTVQAIGLVGLLAPVLVLLVGLAGFRKLRLGNMVAIVLSYPIAFYLDLTGVLLGIADAVTGAAKWRAVSRVEAAPAEADPNPAALITPVGLTEGYRLGEVYRATVRGLASGLRSLSAPSTLVPSALFVVLFGAGAAFTPTTSIEVSFRSCEPLEQDGDPWIVPPSKIKGYCSKDPSEKMAPGRRSGTFHAIDERDPTSLAPTFWDRLDKTFFCNLSKFSPDNVVPVPGAGFQLRVEKRDMGERQYAAGGIVTKKQPDETYRYGRFETVMKPAKQSGVISAFFLYRFDPWQEIDAEFLGNDTTKLLANVYYNPGEEGDLYNYGHFGTPVVIDLGFDASLDFHTYAIEWEETELRWFVDDKLVHVRKDGFPTPIPHLPMQFFVNIWPCCSEALVGPFDLGDGTATAEVRSISIARWYPAPFAKVIQRVDALFAPERERDWRKSAPWMKP